MFKLGDHDKLKSFQKDFWHSLQTENVLGYFTCICSGVHWSKLTDLTLDIWTPRFRCIPAHLMQIKTPVFQEAHLGPKGSGEIN